MKAKRKQRSNRVASDDGLGVCPTCGKPLVVLDPEKIANDLLEGFNNGLSGDDLLKFARRSLTPNRG